PNDQGATLRCAPYAGAKNGEYVYDTPMHPDFQTVLVGKIQKRSVDLEGSDPNSAMKSQCFDQGGYLPFADSPITLAKDGPQVSIDPASYSQENYEEAHNYGGEGFVRVDGPHDHFDNIRIALYMAYDPVKKRGVCVQPFGKWYREWTYAATIPTIYEQLAGYHSYLFVDWVTIDGIAYLLAENTYGPSAGQGGYHYFPREVVNREFSAWGTSLKILKPLTLEQIALAKQETPIGKIQRAIANVWYALTLYIIERYGRNTR
ncbi:MAG: hypothetical protein NUV54_02055, partial [Candidatus Taylorbacteria bacterium]|nr:hypothetical protein [Candidatus Taylorbacteria bacterium]